MPCITDNQGNEALIVKNMTTKFPVYLVLLELTEQVSKHNWALNLRWERRDKNQDADDLTNGDFSKFSAANRLDPPLGDLPWLVLPTLFVQALDLHEIVSEQKAKARRLAEPPLIGVPKKKLRKPDGLRITDPW